jgi:hypothetical protein
VGLEFRQSTLFQAKLTGLTMIPEARRSECAEDRSGFDTHLLGSHSATDGCSDIDSERKI